MHQHPRRLASAATPPRAKPARTNNGREEYPDKRGYSDKEEYAEKAISGYETSGLTSRVPGGRDSEITQSWDERQAAWDERRASEQKSAEKLNLIVKVQQLVQSLHICAG